MATSNVYYPHAIDLDGGTTVITQLSNPRPSFNHRDLVEFPAGGIGPDFTGSHDAAPDLVFETTSLKQLLDACTDTGIVADLSGDNVDVEYRAGDNRGVRTAAATTSHMRLRMQANAFLSWQRITAEQGGLANATARLLPVYDGSNSPLVATSGVALGVTSSVISALYTLGPVAINGSTLGGVTRMTWDNQIEYEEILSDGEPYITYGAVKRFAPVITFTCENATLFSTHGDGGTALSSFVLYLRKKFKSGFNEAIAAEVHIKFTHSAGTVKSRQLDGDDGNVEVAVHLAQASNVWFTVDTTAAIS